MKPTQKRKASGITLLEVMLVLAITILGIVIGLQQYQRAVFNRNVAQIKNSVRLLNSALQQYYLTNCYWFLTDANSYTAPYSITPNMNPTFLPAPSNPPNPPLQSYITQPQLIGNAYSGSHLGGINAYTYTIDTTGDFPLLSVSTAFTANIPLQDTLVGALSPTSRNGNIFTWSATPNNALLTSPGLNPNLAYTQWLAAKYNVPTTSTSQQISYQYTSGTNSSINVCAYWQQPRIRCQVTHQNCDYRNGP